MPSPTGIAWLDALVLPAIAVMALTIIYRGGRSVLRIVRRIGRFLDDWDGHAEQPGVMARLKAIEDQLRPNGGESLRDRVDKIERHVRPIEES